MGLLDIFKLEKLKILAYEDVKRSGSAPKYSFEAMFNPTSLEQQFGIAWGKNQAMNASNQQVHYARSKPSELKLDLILDGTGADELGIYVRQKRSVKERLDELLTTTFRYNGNVHEPNYLVVAWGSWYRFTCRLSTLDIKYTLFDRDGSPLRAEVALVFISDQDAKERAKQENKSSPDLTHARIVCAGDTLPLLTHSIYGSSERCLDVAKYNGLDDFRRLIPGQQLLFPPLAAFDVLGNEASERGRPPCPS